MTDAEIQTLLREKGYPEHVWRDGRGGLIARWTNFVEQVGQGYSMSMDDYCNDLDTRAIIARLGLQKEVAELDRRFRQLLVFTADPIWECDDNPDAFWLFGYPGNAAGDLLEDLRAEGFVK